MNNQEHPRVHGRAFIYAINNFQLKDDFLQHIRFVIFCDQKWTFQSVLFLVEKLNLYINFCDQDFCLLEVEFGPLQPITLDDISEEAVKEAVICHDHEENEVIYRIDVLWYYLSLQKITGTSRLKFHQLFNNVRPTLHK